MRRLGMIVALLALAGGAAWAADRVEAGGIAVREAWVRASLGSAPNSVAYMIIEATGEQPDRLTGASSPAAERVALHTHVVEDGVARMRPVEAIEVAPGTPTVLAPGGLHLMLTGLKETLEEGARVPLTLTFEHAGEVELEVPVRGLAYRMPMPHGSHGQHHSAPSQ